MMTIHPVPLPVPAAGFTPVNKEELARLMEMPGSFAFDELIRKTIRETERWCRQHVTPWQAQRLMEISRIDNGRLTLDDGTSLRTGTAFHHKLAETRAHSIIIFGCTVGDALDRRAVELWKAERFHESYVLRACGAGLAEASRTRHSVALCAWAEAQGWSILSSDGPGYRDWLLEEIHELHRLLAEHSAKPMAEHLRINEEGMLQPLHSTIVVFGVTAFKTTALKSGNRIPCHECDLSPCRFRRRQRSVSRKAVRL